MLDTIPEPLRDRMEIMRLQATPKTDKAHIAERYLFPSKIEENGLTKDRLKFRKDAVRSSSRHYTREAGVRNLERNIGECAANKAPHAEGKRKN